MRKLFVIIALTAACASMPPRDRAIKGIEIVDSSLSAFQDAERRICNEAEYNKAVAAGTQLTAAITTCTGMLAQAAKLTTETHQKIASLLAEAFKLQQKAVLVIQALGPNDPVPGEVNDLLTKTRAIAAVVIGLAGTDQQQKLVSLVNTTVDQIQKIIDELRGGKNAL